MAVRGKHGARRRARVRPRASRGHGLRRRGRRFGRL